VNYKIYGFAYILFLSFFISIQVSSKTKQSLNQFIGATPNYSFEDNSENYDYIVSQIPKLRIEDNKFKNYGFDGLLNVASKSGKDILLVDTQDAIQDFSLYSDLLIIRSDRVLFLLGDDILTLQLPDIISQVPQYISKGDGQTIFDMQLLFDDLRGFFIAPQFLLLIISMFWFFLRYSFKAIAFSFFVGLICNMVLKSRRFTFRAFLRISSFSMTIVFLLEFISISIGGALFSRPELIYFIAHLLYIYYAVDSYKQITFKNS
jgi:hypothetical protein